MLNGSSRSSMDKQSAEMAVIEAALGLSEASQPFE